MSRNEVTWHVPRSMTIEYMQSPKATIVEVHHEGKKYIGTAICHRDDPFDKDIGYNLALARALDSITKEYYKKAESAISQNDNDRMQRELQVNSTRRLHWGRRDYIP